MKKKRRLSFKQLQALPPDKYQLWKDGYTSGLKGAISFASQWDGQLAPILEGRRFSDIIAGKFNLRKRVRNVPKEGYSVKETFQYRLNISLSKYLSMTGGVHRKGDTRAVVVFMPDQEKFRLGDPVRLILEKLK